MFACILNPQFRPVSEEVAKEILGVLRKQIVGSFDKFCEVLSDFGDPTLDDLLKRLLSRQLESKDLLEQISCTLV